MAHARMQTRPLALALRIGAVVLVAWWLLRNLALAQVPSAFEWPKTDFDNATVPLSEIISGGPPKDGIPAIDDPKFSGVDAAMGVYDPREPVAVVALDGDARAYPLSVLIWHEIVNDTVGGIPVSVTFCPLCNATLAFDRRVGDRVLDFGTTGRLRKSDMVMYDRQTESWWQQFTGTGIVGELAGTRLVEIPASIVSLGDFAEGYPTGRVLTRETGHARAYGRNPYRGYDDIDATPFLYRDPLDPRLPPMERVIAVTHADAATLYPFRAFDESPVLNDRVGDLDVAVFSRRGTLSVLDAGTIAKARTVPSATAWSRRVDGRTLTFEVRDTAIHDAETGSRWNLLGRAVEGPLAGRQLDALPGGVHFAFAWLAFRPDSRIHGQ